MLPESVGLLNDSTVVLHSLESHDSIGLDGIHLSALGSHVSPLPRTVFGHVDGEKYVRPHDKENNDRVEGVILHKEEQASHEDIEDHGEDLEQEILQESIHRSATTESACHLTSLLAQMEFQGEAKNMFKGSARQTSIEGL